MHVCCRYSTSVLFFPPKDWNCLAWLPFLFWHRMGGGGEEGTELWQEVCVVHKGTNDDHPILSYNNPILSAAIIIMPLSLFLYALLILPEWPVHRVGERKKERKKRERMAHPILPMLCYPIHKSEKWSKARQGRKRSSSFKQNSDSYSFMPSPSLSQGTM